MTPTDCEARMIQGDCLAVLPTLPADHFHVCVCSPPYYSLRSYLPADDPLKPLEIGSETTPEAFIETMVKVFAEVRRVMHPTGLLFLNLGDSYGSSGGVSAGNENKGNHGSGTRAVRIGGDGQLLNMPHRVAEALRADGWHWRQTIVWAKRSPMPESCKGWRFERCKRKTGRKAVDWQATPKGWDCGEGSHDAVPDGNYRQNTQREPTVAVYEPCPGCDKCTPHGGYVLRKGKGRCTTAHEFVFVLAKGDWKTTVVPFSDLPSERIIFGKNGLLESQAVGAESFAVVLASAILDCPEFKKYFGLPSLDAEIGQKGLGYLSGMTVADVPIEHRAAVWAAAFLASDITTKQFLCNLDGLGIALSDTNDLLIAGVRIPTAVSGIHRYGKTSVAVHHPGKICEFDFVHRRIILHSQAGCNYFWDSAAFVEEPTEGSKKRFANGLPRVPPRKAAGLEGEVRAGADLCSKYVARMKNPRSVWLLSSEPTSVPHFATYPSELVRRCIQAGTSDGGCCPECGEPWAPVVETEQLKRERPADRTGYHEGCDGNTCGNTVAGVETKILGYRPTCECGAESVPCRVLDPFAGIGTTLQTAQWMKREATGIELNPEYVAHAEQRIDEPPRWWKRKHPAKKRIEDSLGQLRLFT